MKWKDAMWGGRRQKKRRWHSKLVVEKERVGVLVRGGRRLSVANLSRRRTFLFFFQGLSSSDMILLYYRCFIYSSVGSTMKMSTPRWPRTQVVSSPPACQVVRATLVPLVATSQKVGKQIIFFKHSFLRYNIILL